VYKRQILAFFEGETHILLLSFFNKKTELIKIVKDDRFETSSKQYLAAIQSRDASAYMVKQLAASGYILFEKLLVDVLEQKKVESILLLTDGKLAQIPFEALATEVYEGNELREIPYLIHRYQIGYTDALRLHINRKQEQKGRENLAIFSPQYSGNLAIPHNPATAAALLQHVSGIDLSHTSIANPASFQELSLLYDMFHFSLHGKTDTINPDQSFLQFQTSLDPDFKLYSHKIFTAQLH